MLLFLLLRLQGCMFSHHQGYYAAGVSAAICVKLLLHGPGLQQAVEQSNKPEAPVKHHCI
jgi:hypothetical protein